MGGKKGEWKEKEGIGKGKVLREKCGRERGERDGSGKKI
jgi:hypothetical protein